MSRRVGVKRGRKDETNWFKPIKHSKILNRCCKRCHAATMISAVTATASRSLRLCRHASSALPTYVAAIDQGTSSSRVVLYDTATLMPAAAGQTPLSITTPQVGWAQMDANTILASVETCAAAALAEAGATAAQVVGVGITNQRETTVVWDRNTGEPLHDAVLWLDTRTRETVADLVEAPGVGGVDGLRGVCGLPLSTYFTGVKLRWLIDNVPDVREGLENGTALVGTVDSWLIWKLTGGAQVRGVGGGGWRGGLCVDERRRGWRVEGREGRGWRVKGSMWMWGKEKVFV